MIAKIVTKDKREFYSTVFAYCDNGWDTAVVVFDDEKDEFLFVRMYRYTKGLTRSVFIVDVDEEMFVKGRTMPGKFLKKIKNVAGYDWLLDDEKLFCDIISNKSIDERYKNKARALNKEITISEWTLVRNKKDVESLMSAAWGFHDGVIGKIAYNAEDQVEVLISGCWGAEITLIFQGEPVIHFISGDFYEQLFSSNVFFEDGFVYWVDEDSIDSVAKLKKNATVSYFRSRALKWKQKTEYNDSKTEY